MFRAKVLTFGRELGSHTIARAFLLSLLVHFIGISGVELGARLGWWKTSIRDISKAFSPEDPEQAKQRALEQIQQAIQQQPPEAQLVFVEVDPTQVAPEPPKDAKFYSSQSTVASNPDPSDKQMPKIDGQQEQVVKTFDTMRPTPQAPQPTPQPEVKGEKPQPKAPETKPQPQRPNLEEDPKPQTPQQPGETLLARAPPRPQQPPPTPPEEKRRPRTLAEAKAQKGIIEGRKARMEGGARKHSVGTNLDVRATPFGAYDQAFITAVQARWFSLLDERDFVGGQSGKVVLEFRLNYDGRITALRVVESEVNEMLSWFCQRAILDPAPFRPFPSDLRRLLNNDFREVRFTFYYNQ